MKYNFYDNGDSLYDDLESWDSTDDRILEASLPAQRQILQKFLNRPEIIEHAGDAPLQWLLQSIDVEQLQAEILQDFDA